MLFLLLLIPVLLAPQGDVATHFEAARRCEAAADFVCAEREYRRVTQLAPDSAEAFNNLGIALNRLGRAEEAAAAFTRAAEVNPRLTGAHLNLAITHFRAQRFAEAEPALRRALALEPGNAQAAGLLVLSLFAQERYAEVAALAEGLLAGDPDDAGLLEVAGRSYLKMRRYEDALRVLGRRAGLRPESAAVHLLLGEARDNLHDTEGAIEEFRRAVAAGAPAPPDAHFALGYALWKLRRYDEAEAEFQKELGRDPEHARSAYYLGDMALSRHDLARALPLLERAARSLPQDFDARYGLGKALLQHGDAERAAAELRAAAGLNPKHSGAHYQLAQALQRLKLHEEARREFAIARELNRAEREDLERKVQGEERKKRAP